MGRAADVNDLINESIDLHKKNKSAALSVKLSFLFTTLIFTLGILAYVFLFQTRIALIGLAILVLLITMYSRAFFSMVHSWNVANAIWEEKLSFIEGFRRTTKMAVDVASYSVIILIVGLMNNSFSRNKKNILSGIIKKPFEGISEDMWDITAHLTLPSMIITKNNFAIALQEVKNGMSFVPEIKIRPLQLERVTYPLMIIALIISIIIGWVFFPSLAVLVFLSVALIVFLVQSFIKTTYYTVLYIWMGEQIQRKKKKKTLETRVPPVLENFITVKLR